MALGINEFPKNTLKPERFQSLLPRSNEPSSNNIIRAVAQTDKLDHIKLSIIFGYDNDISGGGQPFFSTEILVIPDNREEHTFTGYYYEYEEQAISDEIHTFREEVSGLLIYKIEPASFQISAALSHQAKISASGSNIVNFLYYLSQNYKSRYRALESDFARCVTDLVSISTPADPNESGKLKLKFFDQNDVSFWAEEVSEGILYFLALLCIVHQPDPPKLLLLEEPEKGIHPRRIKEVMDFIFELAELRDIQIIITSHSPYVVDHFADIPECISVFDRKDGETVVRNAADIIEETNAKLNKPIRYSDALGEHWVSGFLGGVPV